jgi:hypothetical protein
MGFQNPIVGGTALRIPAIQSPDFATGVSGWIIRIDGSAEFNNLTIRGTFEGNDFVLNSHGLFIYDGTPALGNLIANISPTDGTDDFGNTYFGGIVTYTSGGGEFAALSTGNLLLGLVSDGYATAGLVGLSGGEAIFLSSPQSGTSPDASTATLAAGDRTETPVNGAFFPHWLIDGALWVRDPMVAAQNNANVWSPEEWHAPTLNANWSSTTTFGTISGGLAAIRYRKDTENNVWVQGCFKAAAGASTSVFQLPVGYRPQTDNNAIPVAFISSGGTPGNAWAYISQAGNLNLNSQLGSAVTTNTTYYVNGKVPLGDID